MSSSSTHSVGLRLEQNHSKQAFLTEKLRSELYCHSTETLTSSHYKLTYELKYEQYSKHNSKNSKERGKEESNSGPVLSMQPEKPKTNWLQENPTPKEADATPWDTLCVDPQGQ